MEVGCIGGSCRFGKTKASCFNAEYLAVTIRFDYSIQKGAAMDYETIGAGDFGRSLRGLGLNILVRDVASLTAFLVDVFEMKAFQATADFAILTYGDDVFQLHSDGTYHSNPLLSLVPELGARGGGAEFRLYDTDPDLAVTRADGHVHDATILQTPTNKPHGLREAFILCENGYAWVPSRALTDGDN